MSGDSRSRILPQAVLDAMPGAVAQLGSAGEILGVNANWRTLAAEGHILSSTNVTPSTNYIEACERSATAGAPMAADAVGALRAVLSGESGSRSLKYTTTFAVPRRSFAMVITRLSGDGYDGAIVTHFEVTPRTPDEDRLSGRRGHEFNNLLTVMLGYAELLRDNRELPASCRTAVDEILDAARRASDLMAPPQE